MKIFEPASEEKSDLDSDRVEFEEAYKKLSCSSSSVKKSGFHEKPKTPTGGATILINGEPFISLEE